MAPKKPGKTKAIQEAHAKARAEQRYGISLNSEDRRNIVKMIQQDQEGASFVARSSSTRSLWKVDYNDTSMNVVYDKTRHSLCSVLPPTAAEFQVSCSVNPTQTSGSGCIECNQTICQCPGNWEDWK
jgi:hypothetical protein